MKIRFDFVSNSSSSSYVVSCRKQHIGFVTKDLAKACSHRGKYHISGLTEKNKNKLDFCIHTFQLAFLGRLLVDTKEEVYSIETFKKMLSKTGKSNIDRAAEIEWNAYKEDVRYAKEHAQSSNYFDIWKVKEYGDDIYDPTTDTIKHHIKTFASNIVVSNDVMEYDLLCSQYRSRDDATIEKKVKILFNMAKNSSKYENYRHIGSIDIFQITQNTIDNTRDLLSYGHKVDLEPWENLDDLESIIANDNIIFSIRIADSGDGIGDFYLYRESDSEGIYGIAGITILDSYRM